MKIIIADKIAKSVVETFITFIVEFKNSRPYTSKHPNIQSCPPQSNELLLENLN